MFDYEPRYYKPEEDPEEKRKKKLGFRSVRKIRRKQKPLMFWLILLIVILYLYLKMSGKI